MSYPRRSVLITGCSAGSIGDGVAKEFNKRGFQVFATARTLSKIAHLKELGIETILLDVTSSESIQSAMKTVSSHTNGTLDILFNNAAQSYMMPLADVDVATMRAVYEVNVFAVVAMTQAFLPLLISSKGIILNHGSMASLINMPGPGAYSSSKAALASISDTLRVELAPFSVRVVHLITGLCKSNMYPPDTLAKLPINSIYEPVRKQFEATMNGESVQHKVTENDVYAKKLVSDLIDHKNPAKWLYEGAMSGVAWFFSTFVWKGIMDGQMMKIAGLDKLTNKRK